jgi:hypothetical protein
MLSIMSALVGTVAALYLRDIRNFIFMEIESFSIPSQYKIRLPVAQFSIQPFRDDARHGIA